MEIVNYIFEYIGKIIVFIGVVFYVIPKFHKWIDKRVKLYSRILNMFLIPFSSLQILLFWNDKHLIKTYRGWHKFKYVENKKWEFRLITYLMRVRYYKILKLK